MPASTGASQALLFTLRARLRSFSSKRGNVNIHSAASSCTRVSLTPDGLTTRLLLECYARARRRGWWHLDPLPSARDQGPAIFHGHAETTLGIRHIAPAGQAARAANGDGRPQRDQGLPRIGRNRIYQRRSTTFSKRPPNTRMTRMRTTLTPRSCPCAIAHSAFFLRKRAEFVGARVCCFVILSEDMGQT